MKRPSLSPTLTLSYWPKGNTELTLTAKENKTRSLFPQRNEGENVRCTP